MLLYKRVLTVYKNYVLCYNIAQFWGVGYGDNN